MGILLAEMNLDSRIVLDFNAMHTPMLDRFSWMMSDMMAWLPFVMTWIYVLIKNKRSEAFLILLVMALMILVSDQVAHSIKPLVARPRPTRNMALIPLLEVVNDYHGGMYGFPSNHAANLFSLAVFSALLFRERLYTICILVWATLISLTRVYLAVHYLSDILCGAALGALIGYGAFALYRYIVKYPILRAHNLPVEASDETHSGYAKRDLNLLLLVLATVTLSLLLAACIMDFQ